MGTETIPAKNGNQYVNDQSWVPQSAVSLKIRWTDISPVLKLLVVVVVIVVVVVVVVVQYCLRTNLTIFYLKKSMGIWWKQEKCIKGFEISTDKSSGISYLVNIFRSWSGSNFIIKDLPSVSILIIADQI